MHQAPEKKRNADAQLFTTDASELLNDESINVIVELIDDSEEAYHIVRYCFKKQEGCCECQ
jgi:homoserine dehydrogenase